jgi:hypothetical protein
MILTMASLQIFISIKNIFIVDKFTQLKLWSIYYTNFVDVMVAPNAECIWFRFTEFFDGLK